MDAKTQRIALVEIDKGWNLLGRIKEAANLYKKKRVGKIFLHMADFSEPSRLFSAGNTCMGYGVPLDDIIMDESDLTSFVRDSKEGVQLLIVLTTWMGFISSWYRFKKLPQWVWLPIEFHAAGVL